MLRIDIHQGTETTSFTLEGKLMGPWVGELENCWHNLIAAEPSRAILVQLAAVTFIDSQGKALLTQMCRQGVRLVPTGCLMRAIVHEIEVEVKKEK